MQICLTIVDNSAFYCAGLEAVLRPETDIRLVGTCTCAQEALQISPETRPHVVLLCLNGSPQDKLQLTLALAAVPSVRVIWLSAHPSTEEMQQAIRSGAYGYFSKSIDPCDLVMAVRMAAQGNHMTLSERELDILRHITAGKSVREIAKLLKLREKRVGKIVGSAIVKLGANNRTHAVVRAMQLGWIPLREPASPQQVV